MLKRRIVVLGGVSGVILAGCTPPAGTVTINAQGAAGMNQGPDGSDRPLTLTVVQMRGSSAFDAADFFALQDPQAALGGDFVKADTIVLTGAGQVTKVIGLESGAALVGVIAGFRDPAGKVFRRRIAVAPTGDTGLIVSVGAGGLSLATA